MGIWDQLNTRTLFGSAKATAEQVNTQEKDVHLEEKNRALLADVNLINKSLMRDGRVIPESGVLTDVTLTDNGWANRVVMMSPAQGEVMRYVAASALSNTTPSDSQSFYFFLIDRTIDNSGSSSGVYLDSISSGNSNLALATGDPLTNNGFEIAYPFQLIVYVGTMQGTSSIVCKTATVRVR